MRLPCYPEWQLKSPPWRSFAPGEPPEEARRSLTDPGRRAAGLAEAAMAGTPWRMRHPVAAWRVAFGVRWRMVLGGGLRALFPSPRFMAQRPGIRAGSPLLPLTYPWRFLSALGRALTGR